MLRVVILIFIIRTISVSETQNIGDNLEVICDPFDASEDNHTTKSSSPFSKTVLSYKSNTEYCQCSLNTLGSGRTAIVKCDFSFEKDILLTENLFPFQKWKVSSAYVRMTNAKSAIITSKFLSAWMDAPSSALDLWHCGQVVIESTPVPHELQVFSNFKTFIGVGIIDCHIVNLPSYFLRDRNRGALRLKECYVEKINASLFHNIDEIRYMIFEDTIVDEIGGPLSSSGALTLSKKEIHSWDGIQFNNATFKRVAQFAFNVTHKNDMEKFEIKKSKFEHLGEGAIIATGEIDFDVTNTSFSNMESLALQVTVNGRITFSNNVIEASQPDSLLGISCRQDSSINNNILYVLSKQADEKVIHFSENCGILNVSYVVVPKEASSMPVIASSFVTVTVMLVTIILCGVFIWTWKNRALLQYHYRRTDTPLCHDETVADSEETTSRDSPANKYSNIVYNNETFMNQHLKT